MPPWLTHAYYACRRVLIFFTRYPLPPLTGRPARADLMLADAAWALPLVGILAAAPAALALLLPEPLGVWLALALLLLTSGALHEDGWADVWDASGGATRERRLAILKDSRVGSYGVLALGVLLLVRWQGLTEASPLQLLAIAALSRGLVAFTFRNRWQLGGGLAARVGTLSLSQGLLLGAQLLLLLLLLPPAAWLLALLAVLLMALWLKRLLGGFNGDGYGAMIIAAELGAWGGLLL